MKLKAGTLLFLTAVTIAIFIFLFILRILINKKIETSEDERSSRNAIEEIISVAENNAVVNENLKGKTVVINVWATWCGPCRSEIPELNKLANEFRSNDIVFIALDSEDSTKEAKIMASKQIWFEYQLLFNQGNTINKIRSFLLPDERDAIPINMVINTEGKVKIFYVGTNGEKLEEMRRYLASIKGHSF